MSKRGENIYKRKDNRWEGRYLKGHSVAGKPLFGYVYAKSYHETKRKLTEAQNSFNTCQKNIKQSKIFSDYCDEWLLLNRNHVKESTYAKYSNMIKKYINPLLGNRLPNTLNSAVIEQFSNHLLSSDLHGKKSALAPKTVKDILVLLQSILKYVKKQLGNQISDIEIIYPKDQKKEIRVLTKSEQSRLIQYLITDMDDCKFGVLLALLTGMRIGELCALRWSDISLSEKTIQISRTMQRIQQTEWVDGNKTKILISDPKSETSKRIIPLTAYAAELCRNIKSHNSSAYVLTGKKNCFMEPRALQYRIVKYTKESGLKDIHFHTLRHTFATRCVEVGFEIKSLSEILGHSSVKVTLDRYVHTSLELKRENMDKLSAIGF